MHQCIFIRLGLGFYCCISSWKKNEKVQFITIQYNNIRIKVEIIFLKIYQVNMVTS